MATIEIEMKIKDINRVLSTNNLISNAILNPKSWQSCLLDTKLRKAAILFKIN